MELKTREIYFTIALFFLLIAIRLPAIAYTYDSTLSESTAQETAQLLADNPTYVVERTFRYPARDQLILYLFHHLEMAGAMTRAWNFTDLEIKNTGDRIYSTRIKTKMEGTCYQMNLESGHLKYVGLGTYRSSNLPFNIYGAAMIEVTWKELKNENGVKMSARLSLRPTSEILHLIGYVLSPIVHSELEDGLKKVVQLGRNVGDRISNKPIETVHRLKSERRIYARQWSDYLDQSSLAD